MESPSDPSVPLPAVVSFTPSFEQAGIKVTPPAFHLLEVDRKQFIVMRKTPICNDYELLAEIGKGSFGSVLRAKQRTTGETRAVKRINKLNLSL
jgi:serine/threonine protein kinase